MIFIDRWIRFFAKDINLPIKCNVDKSTQMSIKHNCKCKYFCKGMMYPKDGKKVAIFLEPSFKNKF
jgi:hypothetical protein